MELFFAKLLGLYFIIMGGVVGMRRKAIIPVISEFLKNRPLLLVMAVIELAAGIALALAFPVVSLSISGLVSLVGYMMIAEGLIYLAAPLTFVRKFVGMFNTPSWYLWGGIVSVLIGVYLAGKGFGFF